MTWGSNATFGLGSIILPSFSSAAMSDKFIVHGKVMGVLLTFSPVFVLGFAAMLDRFIEHGTVIGVLIAFPLLLVSDTVSMGSVDGWLISGSVASVHLLAGEL